MRKLWLDWERGLAVLFMVEVHAVDAWLDPARRAGALYAALNMVGGFAAPSFLFMAGMSQGLADGALERRGVTAGERRRRALRRALWLLGVAYLFRLGEFCLGLAFLVPGGWQGILRVDVLNVIAAGLALSALVSVGLPRWAHVALAAGLAAAFAVFAPPLAGWERAPSRVLDYLWAAPPRANFTLFNWAGFLLAGSAAGRLVVGKGSERDRPGLALVLGGALVALGAALDAAPPFFAHQDFWRTSPAWFSMRLGVVVMLTGALQLVPAAADRALSWLRTLGRHSLLGYMASVELTYGLSTRPLHRRTPMWAVLAGFAVLTGATWALSVAKERYWDARKARPAPPVTSPAP